MIILAIWFKFVESFSNFDEKLIFVVHLFDDFNEVGDELITNPIMAWVRMGLPKTEAMTGSLPAAFNFRLGLSLLSSSMYTVQSYSWLSSKLISKFKNS